MRRADGGGGGGASAMSGRRALHSGLGCVCGKCTSDSDQKFFKLGAFSLFFFFNKDE